MECGATRINGVTNCGCKHIIARVNKGGMQMSNAFLTANKGKNFRRRIKGDSESALHIGCASLSIFD